MQLYQRVLVASDLTPNSDYIIERAVAVAKQNQAEVFLIHAIEHSPVAYGGEFSVTIAADYEAELEHQAKLALAKQAQKFNIAEDHQEVALGAVKIITADFVKAHNIDLLIIGANDKHGLERLLGSHANAILHAVDCDVLIIKPKAK